jgi:hypothetical protein
MSRLKKFNGFYANGVSGREGAIGNGTPGDFSGFDPSFDTVWRSEGRLTNRGYLVLIAIPFKSLRFPDRLGVPGRTRCINTDAAARR